jgi:hypothetical protein
MVRLARRAGECPSKHAPALAPPRIPPLLALEVEDDRPTAPAQQPPRVDPQDGCRQSHLGTGTHRQRAATETGSPGPPRTVAKYLRRGGTMRTSDSKQRNDNEYRRYQRTAQRMMAGSVCRHLKIAGRVGTGSSAYQPTAPRSCNTTLLSDGEDETVSRSPNFRFATLPFHNRSDSPPLVNRHRVHLSAA